MRKIRFIRFLRVCELGAKLFFVAVLVIYPYQTAAEGEYFAKSDEDGVMYLCQWWADEARGEHYAPEGAESNGYSQLKIFHIFKI